MLWKNRHRNPGLSVTVTQKDIDGLKQCLDYQKLEAEVNILRRPDSVVIALVERDTQLTDKDGTVTSLGNAISPIENNEADFEKAAKEKRLQGIREMAPQLAARLLSEDLAGICSRDTVTQCAEALQVLSKA